MGSDLCEVDCALFGSLAQIMWNYSGSPYETMVKGKVLAVCSIAYCHPLNKTRIACYDCVLGHLWLCMCWLYCNNWMFMYYYIYKAWFLFLFTSEIPEPERIRVTGEGDTLAGLGPVPEAAQDELTAEVKVVAMVMMMRMIMIMKVNSVIILSLFSFSLFPPFFFSHSPSIFWHVYY